MTEEQIFKERFPEYCVGEKCLSPYFDLFQIGFEEGENHGKELQALHKEIVGIQNECASKLQIEIKQLQEENGRLKKDPEETQDLATIAYMQGASKYKAKLEEAKIIIQDLLSNSDEYARQRAMDWLKEE
jgi:hypothetical protein